MNKLAPLAITDVVKSYPFRARNACETFVTVDRRGRTGMMFIRTLYQGEEQVYVISRHNAEKHLRAMTQDERSAFAKALGVPVKLVNARAKLLSDKEEVERAQYNIEYLRRDAAKLGYAIRKIGPK